METKNIGQPSEAQAAKRAMDEARRQRATGTAASGGSGVQSGRPPTDERPLPRAGGNQRAAVPVKHKGSSCLPKSVKCS
jgi:hypothetical protein